MWFKVDDGLHASRKVIRIPRSIRLAAIGLWTISGSWSAHEELDGLVLALLHCDGYVASERRTRDLGLSELRADAPWNRHP